MSGARGDGGGGPSVRSIRAEIAGCTELRKKSRVFQANRGQCNGCNKPIRDKRGLFARTAVVGQRRFSYNDSCPVRCDCNGSDRAWEYPRLTAKPRILLVCDSRENAEQLLARAAESHDVVVADNPVASVGPSDARAVRRRVRLVGVSPGSLEARQAAAKRADSRRHARRRRAAGQRQHDHLGQRPAARMVGPRQA